MPGNAPAPIEASLALFEMGLCARHVDFLRVGGAVWRARAGAVLAGGGAGLCDKPCATPCAKRLEPREVLNISRRKSTLCWIVGSGGRGARFPISPYEINHVAADSASDSGFVSQSVRHLVPSFKRPVQAYRVVNEGSLRSAKLLFERRFSNPPARSNPAASPHRSPMRPASASLQQPAFLLVRPLKVPPAAAASRENLYFRIHGETTSFQRQTPIRQLRQRREGGVQAALTDDRVGAAPPRASPMHNSRTLVPC